jgi:hypothetical protein
MGLFPFLESNFAYEYFLELFCFSQKCTINASLTAEKFHLTHYFVSWKTCIKISASSGCLLNCLAYTDKTCGLHHYHPKRKTHSTHSPSHPMSKGREVASAAVQRDRWCT